MVAKGQSLTGKVFRPRRARQVIYPLAAVLVGCVVGVNLWLPSSGRGGWGIGSRLSLVLFTAAVVAFLHRLASVRVVIEPDHATVVNIVHRRRLEWAEIVGVRLLADDSWMMLDLSDGDVMAAMGVQRADGGYAEAQARVFAQLVNQRTRAGFGDH